VGANATVPLLGWKVVVQEPADEALKPLRHLQRQSTLWLAIGLLVAVVLGVTSVRTVTRPIHKLREAALAVMGGALETGVDIKGKDELAQLGEAFNTMTRGLREREGLKLTLALSETLKLEEVLERLLDSLGRAVRFDDAAVFIKTRDGKDLTVSRGPRHKEEARHIILSSAHVNKAIATRQPALDEGQKMLALPLIQRGVVIGVVCLESHQPYDQAITRLAFSLTQPAAMAVENARLFDEVERLARIDGLTGTYNRRYFMELAQMQFDSARRFSQPLSALMLDFDDFKSVNDRHGHAVGDQVLRGLADRCRSALRSIDLLGRYGGEEFAILLPNTERHSGAAVLAERIRQRIDEAPVNTDAGPIHVTVSVGVASVDDSTEDLGALLKRADLALYEAKQAGRNRVVEDAQIAEKPVA
jgi:diguanylate cyclase (GGDEF)-like protein